jgi:hypothetical protein
MVEFAKVKCVNDATPLHKHGNHTNISNYHSKHSNDMAHTVKKKKEKPVAWLCIISNHVKINIDGEK